MSAMHRKSTHQFSAGAWSLLILALATSPPALANQPDEFSILTLPSLGSGAAFPYIVLDRYNGKLSYCYANINQQFLSSGHCGELESVRRDELGGKIIHGQFSSVSSDRPHYELVPLQSGRGTPLNGFARIDTSTGETDVSYRAREVRRQTSGTMRVITRFRTADRSSGPRLAQTGDLGKPGRSEEVPWAKVRIRDGVLLVDRCATTGNCGPRGLSVPTRQFQSGVE